MSSPWKTYRVSFTAHDCYFIELKARSDDEALARAEHLYTEHGEEPFSFDISQGGTDDWGAEVVA